MKKRIIALLAVLCVTLVTVTACGGGSAAPAATEAAPAATEAAGGEEAAPADTEAAAQAETETAAQAETEAAAPAETEAAAQAETFDVGEFTLDVPAGWKAFPQNDIFGEEDEEGNYPIDPTCIYVSKDAKDDMELLSSPYIYITWVKGTTELLSSRDSWYENTEDLDVSIDDAEIIEAYSGDSTIIEDWSYQIISFKKGDSQFTVMIPTVLYGMAIGYSFEDPEVMGIINSLNGK